MDIHRTSDIVNVPYTSFQLRVKCLQCVFKCRGEQPIMNEVTKKKFAERLIYLLTRRFGITPKNVRKYSFDFTVRFNLKHNFNKDTKMTGEDWFHRFMQRNKKITIRKLEDLFRTTVLCELYGTSEGTLRPSLVMDSPKCC